MHLNMEADQAGKLVGVRSILQVAEVSRPLTSVSKICDQGFKCILDDKGADIVGKDGRSVCHFLVVSKRNICARTQVSIRSSKVQTHFPICLCMEITVPTILVETLPRNNRTLFYPQQGQVRLQP